MAEARKIKFEFGLGSIVDPKMLEGQRRAFEYEGMRYPVINGQNSSRLGDEASPEAQAAFQEQLGNRVYSTRE